MKGRGSRSMGLGRVVLGLAIASLFASVACKEKEPPPPPPFSVADAAKALADVKLDDSFFKTLAELKTHAATDPDAMAAYVRGTVDGLAVALAGNPPAAVKLVGGDPSIPGGVGKALAWRLHDTLGIASLEALEAAAGAG